jgi:succinoglycan biosynthesis transport protein ExoP
MEQTGLERHEATLRDYLGIIFRQKWVILAVLAIPTIIVLVQTVGSRTLYKSTSTVLLRRGQKESALVPYVTILPWEEQVSSEEQTATSAVVATRAQGILNRWQAGVRDEEKIWIRASSADAAIVGESNVLAISYVHHEPEVAKQVTRALTEAYMGYRQESGLTPGLMSFFESEIGRVQTRLDSLRARREQFMQTHNVNNLDWKTRTLLELWRDLSGALSDAMSARLVEQANVEQMRQLIENPDVESPVLSDLPLGGGSVVSSLRAMALTFRLDLQKAQASYTEKDQRVIALRKQLEETEEQLDRETRRTLALSRARLATMMAKEEGLRQQVASIESELMGYPEQEAVLSDLETQIRILEKEFETLNIRRTDAMVSRESSPEWNVILLSPASDAVALRTRDYVRLSLGPLLGLLVGIGLAFLFESLDHSIKTKSEAENLLDLPVVASIADTEELERRR